MIRLRLTLTVLSLTLCLCLVSAEEPPAKAKKEPSAASSGKKGRELSGARITFSPSEFDAMEGKVHRNNLGRTGVFKATGAPLLSKLKWKTKTNGPIRSSAVVVDGILYIGSNDKCIYAMDANTGSILWKVETGGLVAGSAAVYKGLVYIMSEDGVLYALETKTGKEGWKYTVGLNPAGSPAIAYGYVFACSGSRGGHQSFPSTGSKLYALKASDGTKVWEVDTGTAPLSAIATEGTYLYYPVRSDGRTGFADLATGKEVFQTMVGIGGNQYNSTTLANGNWYIPFSTVGMIRCLKGTTPQWTVATYPPNLKYIPNTNRGAKHGHGIIADLAVTDKLVIAGCDDGRLFAFSTENGDNVWTIDVGATIQSSPSVAGNTIYFGSWNGYIYSASMDGKIIAKFKTGDMVNSAPWPANGVVYCASDDGYVYAIE